MASGTPVTLSLKIILPLVTGRSRLALPGTTETTFDADCALSSRRNRKQRVVAPMHVQPLRCDELSRLLRIQSRFDRCDGLQSWHQANDLFLG